MRNYYFPFFFILWIFTWHRACDSQTLTHTHSHGTYGPASKMTSLDSTVCAMHLVHAFLFVVHFANDLMKYNRLCCRSPLECDVRNESESEMLQMTNATGLIDRKASVHDANEAKLNGPDTVTNFYEFIISRIAATAATSSTWTRRNHIDWTHAHTCAARVPSYAMR